MYSFMVGITLSERYGPTEFWYFVSISEIVDARSTVKSAEINPCSPKMSATIFLCVFVVHPYFVFLDAV